MSITGYGNTLLDSMAETCTLLVKHPVQTPTGGYKTTWIDDTSFTAVIRKDESTEARIAEKQGVTELYTVVVQKGFPLDYHDVFRRTSDGNTYRVTSNIQDRQTPASTAINIGSVTAERWDLPDA